MSSTYEGKLEIPAEEFWKWVNTFMPEPSHESRWGVPRYNPSNETLDILFAAGYVGPDSWAKKPAAVLDMENYIGDHDRLKQAIRRAIVVAESGCEEPDILQRVVNILKEVVNE